MDKLLSICLQVFAQIGPIILIIMVGYISKFYAKDGTEFSRLIISFSFPALIVSNFFTKVSSQELISYMIIIFLGISTTLIGVAISYSFGKFLKLPEKGHRELMFLSSFGNSGFLGIPFSLAVFGPKGAFYAMLFDFGHTFANWSLGVSIIIGQKTSPWADWKRLCSPPLITYVCCFILVICNFSLPHIFLDFSITLGNTAIPLALIFIGNLLRIHGFVWKDKFLFYIGLLKLIILPLVLWLLIGQLPLPTIIKGVVLLQAGMPTMMAAPIICNRYGIEDTRAVMAVCFTTIVALATCSIISIVFCSFFVI